MDISQLMASMGPIQDAMKQQEQERAQTVLEGRSGGGAVSIRLHGDLSVAGITIAPSAVSADADDVGMLEDLIHTALSDALKQYRDRFGGSAEEQMQKTLAGSDVASLLGGLMGGR